MTALYWPRLVAVLALSAALPTCGRRQLPPESPLDTAANHYTRGMARLTDGDLWTAQSEFERAHALDPDYPGTYVGSAMVALAQGEFWRAKQEIEEAIHRDGGFVDAHVALGRIITEEGRHGGRKPGDWLPRAVKAYGRAIDLDPDAPSVYYYRGMSYYVAGEYASARESLAQVVARNRGDLVGPAMHQIERIQLIERASPGTDQGRAIAAVDRLTRAELAVLLLEELKLADLMRRRRPSEEVGRFRAPDAQPQVPRSAPADIELSWARPWIEEILDLGVAGLEVMPDGLFRPEDAVTRANYARVNEGIMEAIIGDGNLSTRYVGEPSPFPDVRPDSFAFNAISLNVNRGVMAADTLTGRFRPEDTVTGAEALLIIRELQNAVRMEF